MKYPEFESDDEDDDEEDDDEEDDDEENIKLPQLITKETVLAVLKPNGVSCAGPLKKPWAESAPLRSPMLTRLSSCFCASQTEQVSINVNLVEDVEVVEFSVSGEKCVPLARSRPPSSPH